MCCYAQQMTTKNFRVCARSCAGNAWLLPRTSHERHTHENLIEARGTRLARIETATLLPDASETRISRIATRIGTRSSRRGVGLAAVGRLVDASGGRSETITPSMRPLRNLTGRR